MRCWESPGSPAVSQQTQQESPGMFPAHHSHQRLQGCSSSLCHYSTIVPAVLLQLWTEHCSEGIKGSVRRAGDIVFSLVPRADISWSGLWDSLLVSWTKANLVLFSGCWLLFLGSCQLFMDSEEFQPFVMDTRHREDLWNFNRPRALIGVIALCVTYALIK